MNKLKVGNVFKFGFHYDIIIYISYEKDTIKTLSGDGVSMFSIKTFKNKDLVQRIL